jgi:hypothetical protein
MEELGQYPQSESLKDVYAMLEAKNPQELDKLFSAEEQMAMESGEWDYNNPDLLINNVKDALEKVDDATITEDEKWAKDNMLWSWYHHATSDAYVKQDIERLREYSEKAISFGEHANAATHVMYYLGRNMFEEAERSSEEAEDGETQKMCLSIIEAYKENVDFFKQ